MERKRKREKESLKLKLAAILCLSLVSLCVQAEDEDYSYFQLVHANPVKLQSPIYLDTSNAKKVSPKTNTTIPFNLRRFSESEYFSSTIEDTDNLPQPSSSVVESTINSVVEPTIAEEEIIDTPFIPIEDINDFFAPVVVEKQKETSVPPPENSLMPDEPSSNTNVIAEIEEDEDSIEYVAGVTDVDVEGKLISEIKFLGLKSIKRDYILGKINTRLTSLYDENLLQKDLQKIYATGFFTDEMSIEPILKPDDTIKLVFRLKENISVNDVSIIGNTVFETTELMPYIAGMKGQPQNLIEINEAIDKINNHYHEKGYILAKVSSVDDNADGEISFKISEGVINKIDIEGNERTKDFVITRNIMTQAGTVYNEEFLKKDLARVYSSQVFEEVNRDIIPCKNKDGEYNVTVVVKEKVTNTASIGGGIDTGLGAFGSILLKEDNFLGNAQRVSFGGILGSGILLSDTSIKNHMNYQLELNFFEPYFLNADNSLSSKLYFREFGSWNVPLAIERRIGANVGLEHKVKNHKHLTTSLTGGIENIYLKEGDKNKIAYLYDKNNLDISRRAQQLSDGLYLNLSPGIKYSNLDSEENPRNGILAQARFTETFGATDFNHTNGKLYGAVTKFFPVLKKSTFSLTAKGGVKIHGDEMPEVMAYRLGGPYSIRGYRMNGVGAGESFIMGSAELATPLPFVDKLSWDFIKRMRLTFFVDAGKVYDPTLTNIIFDRPEHAISAGIGLRIHIPGVGPISVDYGIPITNPGSYGSKHGYFTFGTSGMNMFYY